jgi:hypothetical protein
MSSQNANPKHFVIICNIMLIKMSDFVLEISVNYLTIYLLSSLSS